SDSGLGQTVPVGSVANPLIPEIVAGIGISRISTPDALPSIFMWEGDDGVVSFGELAPEGTCIKWRMDFDGLSAPTSVTFSRDYDERGLKFFSALPIPPPFSNLLGSVPARFALTTANNNSGTNKRVWWDNAKFQVGTIFSPGMATCGGSGTPNGCRIKS